MGRYGIGDGRVPEIRRVLKGMSVDCTVRDATDATTVLISWDARDRNL